MAERTPDGNELTVFWVARNDDWQGDRIKPDSETHRDAAFDYEKEAGSSLSRHFGMKYVWV